MFVQSYPNLQHLTLEMREELYSGLYILKDGISEFTFANLYLFRETYQYKIARLPDSHIVISGEKEGKRFFMLPCGLPEDFDLFEDLFSRHDFCKCLSACCMEKNRITLESKGYRVFEDRDNFDYLYLRKDLAHLPGKKYHKKRNLVNAFLNNYTYEEKPLTRDAKKDAFALLEEWRKQRDDDGDYRANYEALEKMEILKLTGNIYYVDGNPAGFTIGEPLARGRSFAIHFEKADSRYKGIYQFINRSFAAVLPCRYTYINREQDLGDPGLRQAKLTYRPSCFVKKFKILPPEPQHEN